MDVDDLPAHLVDPVGLTPLRLRTAALASRSATARLPLALLASRGRMSPGDLLTLARTPGTRLPADLDVPALGELALVIAAQELSPADPVDALALLDAALASYGPGKLRARHRRLHVQLALHTGDRARAAALVKRYPRMAATVGMDLANPVHGGRVRPWLRSLRRLLPAGPLDLVDGAGPALDRLRSSAPPVTAPQRITTVVTCYRPDESLVTAVRSLVAQSWQNQEILVVDDGSPAEFDSVLTRCTDLDPRVRLLRMPANGGTYLARNAALAAATGDFVTFQDSDDWSHPKRLEYQVTPLLADPALFSTTSVGMRVTPDLIIERVGHLSHRSYNLSSVLFRRDAAVQRLGFLDTVRKGADAEYAERARAVFGRDAVQHLGGRPYALIRLSTGSLSAAEFRLGWTHPARRAYLSAFRPWHRDIAAGSADPRRPQDPSAPRPFPAPQRLRGPRTGAAPAFDVVVAQDWTPASMDASAAGRLRALVDRGVRVAVLHLDEWRHLADGPADLDAAVQQLIGVGAVAQLVCDEEATARLVVVGSATLLPFAPSTPGAIRADRVVVGAHPDPALVAATSSASRRLFGADAGWRPELAPSVDAPSTVDLGPGVCRPRVGGRPVVGWRAVPGTPVPLDADTADVRVLGADEPLPAHVLGYAVDDLRPREFLAQLDFYLYLGGPQQAVPEALAAGCVAVLPPRLADVYGDAALYGPPERALAVDDFAAQQARGRAWVERHRRHDTWADTVVAALATSPGDDALVAGHPAG